MATREECDDINAQPVDEVEKATEFARNRPFPEPSDLLDDMWADPIPLP